MPSKSGFVNAEVATVIFKRPLSTLWPVATEADKSGSKSISSSVNEPVWQVVEPAAMFADDVTNVDVEKSLEE